MVGLAGCTSNLTVQVIESPELLMSAEGPLFEGANSATATWEFDLKEILGNEKLKVSTVKITSVEVVLKGSDDLPDLENMVFEVTSKNTPMTRIGLYEGAILEGQEFALSIAEQQENLANTFADGKMTFVGDFDLKDEEYYKNLEFTLLVKFEIGIK
jgi:hypothetical protein